MKIVLFEAENYPMFCQWWIGFIGIKIWDYDERHLFFFEYNSSRYFLSILFINFKINY